MPITLKASPVEIELPNGGVYDYPWELESWFLWKSSVLWARCVPGRGSIIDHLFRRADFLMHDTTDMHYSFDRLLGRTREIFEQDPLDGHLFLFVNRLAIV